MDPINRRDATRLLGGAGLAAATLGSAPGQALAQVNRGARPKVIIVGGGPGGGTLAHVLRRGSPEIDVTIIEPKQQYTTCFFSNLYLGGLRPFEALVHDYRGLESLGVTMVREFVVAVDSNKKVIRLRDGTTLSYDKLVLSPGIDFKFSDIPGYSQQALRAMPHAYKAGPQTQLLASQLRAMPDGGVVVLAPPTNPYRCPPGPYERACMIAHYLKTHKPKSKLVLIDPKRSFAKKKLFTQAFNEEYKGIVELHLTNDIDDHAIKHLDPKTMVIETKAGLKLKAAVANIIPAQRAGAIARLSGCADGDWCPIDAGSFASTRVKDIYVIGDSSLAGDMPKSAFAANSQAKVVSNDLEAVLAGKPKYPSRYRNTCWSLLGPRNSVKVGASYAPRNGRVSAVSKFISKREDDRKTRAKTYKESVGWYSGIIAEVFNRKVDPLL